MYSVQPQHYFVDKISVVIISCYIVNTTVMSHHMVNELSGSIKCEEFRD